MTVAMSRHLVRIAILAGHWLLPCRPLQCQPCSASQANRSLALIYRLILLLLSAACRPAADRLYFELKLPPGFQSGHLCARGCELTHLQFFQSTNFMKLFTPYLIAACALIYWPTASFSHIVLENKTAAAGSTYKAVFQVGHGCSGSPTTAIAVQLPAGFQAAKPYPKAGWALAVEPNKLISWTANTKETALQSAHFDEFILRGKLPDTAGPLWFKVLQTCENGNNNWADVPATGTSTQGLKSPAALLEVIAPSAPAAAMPAEHKH